MVGYIKRHWEGENSLAWAYWINGGLLNGIINFAVIVTGHETTIFDEWAPWSLMVIGTVAVGIWSIVGIWRSATNSIVRARTSIPKESAFWGYAAKTMVVIGVMQAGASWVPILVDYGKISELQRSPVATQFYLDYVGETDVVLNGFINDQSVEALTKALVGNTKRRALVLNSPGGFLIPAFELANIVEKQRIIVAAQGKCESACLLVLASAGEAYVTPNVQLVFHHPETTADFVSPELRREVRIQGDKEVDEYYARFKRYGVPEKKLAELRKQGSKIISIGEAYYAHIVDKIWEPKTNEFYEIDAVCKEVNCFVSPL